MLSTMIIALWGLGAVLFLVLTALGFRLERKMRREWSALYRDVKAQLQREVQAHGETRRCTKPCLSVQDLLD